MKFLQDITLGRYIPGDSVVHRADPRIKFTAVVISILLILSATRLWYLVIIGLFFIMIIKMAGLPLRYLLKGVKPFLWLFLCGGIFHLFFTPGRAIGQFNMGLLNITYEGLISGLMVSLRLFLLIIVSSVLTLTTSPLHLVKGMESIFSPLKKIGVPIGNISWMILMSIRFIPVLIVEAERVIKAQTARGRDLDKGNIIRKIRNLIPLLIPIFVRVLRRVNELAYTKLI